jgi:betaine lipid synthase
LTFGSDVQPLHAGIALVTIGSACLFTIVSKSRKNSADTEGPGLVKSFFLFFYSCFIKPHQGDSKGTQQDALESFYKKQAGAYDATRKVLLRGREDMLALVAAQLEAKSKLETTSKRNQNKRIWVDVRLCA